MSVTVLRKCAHDSILAVMAQAVIPAVLSRTRTLLIWVLSLSHVLTLVRPILQVSTYV